jgi:uncharacterized repeat protein (TIGR01451 family)
MAMHRSMKRAALAALVAFATLTPTWALAAGDVTVALTAHRIVQKDGHEALESADKASPGEVVEYRATYRNDGAERVKQLAATLPIPAGMEYTGAAEPRATLGSLDGTTFAPLPLKRRVKLADGREVEQTVPAAEIRWLRWSIATLEPKAERTVRARVRVTPLNSVALEARH